MAYSEQVENSSWSYEEEIQRKRRDQGNGRFSGLKKEVKPVERTGGIQLCGNQEFENSQCGAQCGVMEQCWALRLSQVKVLRVKYAIFDFLILFPLNSPSGNLKLAKKKNCSTTKKWNGVPGWLSWLLVQLLISAHV